MEESRNLVKLLGLIVLAAISVMAVSASAAHAKYLLLLNKASVPKFEHSVKQIGNGSIKAENGLKLECTGGSGTIVESLSGTGEKLNGSTSVTLTGCVWVGSEKTCTIKDGEKGAIKTAATSELSMSGTKYVATEASAQIAVIKTEGELCTIPEKEVLSGTIQAYLEEPLSDTKSKNRVMFDLSAFLGISPVQTLTIALLEADTDPNATFGIHLQNLTGCTPIC